MYQGNNITIDFFDKLGIQFNEFPRNKTVMQRSQLKHHQIGHQKLFVTKWLIRKEFKLLCKQLYLIFENNVFACAKAQRMPNDELALTRDD